MIFKTKKAIFKNKIPYIQFGKGKETLLILWGGPGNNLPKGIILWGILFYIKPLTKKYTIYILTRRSKLPENYSIEKMADDYDELINKELKRRVDIIGLSYGGLILQILGTYENKFINKIVIGMSGYRASEEGKIFDRKYTDFIIQKKFRKALIELTKVVFNKSIKKIFIESLLFFFGNILFDTKYFENKDFLIEVKAEENFNSIKILKKIKYRTLIVCGDKDFYFLMEDVLKLKELIPDNKTIIYNKKGHDLLFCRRFIKDIFDFLKN